MNTKGIFALVLVAVLLVPAASASTVPASNALDDESVETEPQQATTGNDTQQTNYTRLYVDDGYRHLELKPGESDSFTVDVENGEDEAVTISPHVVIPRVGERPVEKSWVSVDVDDATIEPGAERTVNVTVEVPDDADLGRYQGWVAFTDETVSYPGRPPQPVHAVSFATEVTKDPTVFIRSGDHGYSQVQAGESYTHEIVVENTGEQAVPLNPELARQRHSHRPGANTVERSWFDIDSPNEVQPGETATVTVTVTAPADASRGHYDAELDLGLTDPARPEDRDYWQQVHLNFQVWTQPEDPFEKSVNVEEGTQNLTLTLTSNDRYDRNAADTKPAQFDVAWVAPNGTTIDAERVSVTNSGHVDLGDADRRSGVQTDGAYATGGQNKEFVYRVDDPAAGNWTVRIMPEHAVQFGYEIVRDTDG
ncbi:hypothetical protein VB773_08005 [Haloarculaceae archaeon H-GB2-1]|nr:NEW3 domain-containing protein [Haloarculaceae archaeon H-GB1-1]MEA5386009.1 hypothetical protein [Haloarculaceae archaeon H-GB11]MEA5407513.1 hypothetical protein [Haloarculaceae archaeon H-GB2-1]